jgi:hypothetical protein
MDCQTFDDILDEFAAGRLDGPTRARAAVHTARCETCRAASDALIRVLAELSASARPPGPLSSGFTAAVMAKLSTAATKTETPADAPPVVIPLRPSRRRWVWVASVSAAAAAAAVAVGVARFGGEAVPAPRPGPEPSVAVTTPTPTVSTTTPPPAVAAPDPAAVASLAGRLGQRVRATLDVTSAKPTTGQAPAAAASLLGGLDETVASAAANLASSMAGSPMAGDGASPTLDTLQRESRDALRVAGAVAAAPAGGLVNFVMRQGRVLDVGKGL